MLRKLKEKREINLAKKLEKKAEELITLVSRDTNNQLFWDEGKDKKLNNILSDIRNLVGPAQESALKQSEVDRIRTAMEKTQYNSRGGLKKEIDKLKVDITELNDEYVAALAQAKEAKANVGQAKSRNHPGEAEAIDRDQQALDSGLENINASRWKQQDLLTEKQREYDKQTREQVAEIPLLIAALDAEAKQIRAIHSPKHSEVKQASHTKEFKSAKEKSPILAKKLDDQAKELEKFLNPDEKSKKKVASIDSILRNIDQLKQPLQSSLRDPDNASLRSDVVKGYYTIVNIRDHIGRIQARKAAMQRAGEPYEEQEKQERAKIVALVDALKSEATHIRKMEGSKTLMSVQEFKSTTESVPLIKGDHKIITDNLSALSQKSHSRLSLFKSPPPKDPKKNLEALQTCLEKYDGSNSSTILKLKSQVNYAIAKHNAEHKPAPELKRSGPSPTGGV